MEREKIGDRLIEPLVIGAAMILLATIAFPYVSLHRTRGFNERAASDLQHLASAEEAYFRANKIYAADPFKLAGFMESSEVTIKVSEITPTSFRAVARHERGDQTDRKSVV